MFRSILSTALLVTTLTACSKKEDAPSQPASSATTAIATTSAAAPAVAAAGSSNAVAHLPETCAAVARIDFAALLSLPSVKDQVTPALEELKANAAGPNEDFRAFLSDAGIDPMKDVSDLALCMGDIQRGPEGEFTVVLGGNFKPNTIVSSIEKHAKKDKFSVEDFAGTKILADKDGKMFLGQAPDGVVVVASTKVGLEKAFKKTDASKHALPKDATASFVVPAKSMKGLLSEPGNPFFAQANDVGAMLLTVDLKKANASLRVELTTEKAAIELAGVAKMLLGQMASQPSPDPVGGALMAMLSKAKVESKGKELVVEIAIPEAQVNELTKQLGAAMSGKH